MSPFVYERSAEINYATLFDVIVLKCLVQLGNGAD